LPDQKQRFVPTHEILPGKRTCGKRIKDLKVENQQEDCQYFIFKDKSPFIYQEKQ
jgi:hypothetical protein